MVFHEVMGRSDKAEGKAITVSLTHEVTVCKNSLRYIQTETDSIRFDI